MPNETLSDLGEFKLLNQIVLPAVKPAACATELGDDCAFITFPGTDKTLVVTTDAGPRPLVWALGFECYRTWGWYTVVCNASDLASAAATPVAFCSSVEAPEWMKVSDFQAFFEGISDACLACGLQVAGGNIRSAPRFAAHGTALGQVSGSPFVDRRGATPGDHVFVIGQCGTFIFTYLKARRDGLSALTPEEMQTLTRPLPQLRQMRTLNAAGVVHAASDNSDGVLGAIWNICERSGCSVQIDLDESKIPEPVSKAAAEDKLSPWNILFFWGDYNVAVAVRHEQLVTFQRVVREEKIKYLHLGRFCEGNPAIYGLSGSEARKLKVLRNENFLPDGYNRSPSDHVQAMLTSDLF